MLLNLLMSSDSFLVDSLGFSIYSRGPHSYWNWASQQEVSGGASKRSFICIYSRSPWLILLPVRSAAALGSHRSGNPTVNCACEGSRWRSSYENLMPGDLRWSWGADASAGEWLQIQIIISREVWLHRDHNKSTSCRLISKPYQWVASETSSGLPLILHYDELYNYFIIYYNVIIIEIKCTINVMCLNHPETIPHPGQSVENCLPQNWSLVPKRLGTAVLDYKMPKTSFYFGLPLQLN